MFTFRSEKVRSLLQSFIIWASLLEVYCNLSESSCSFFYLETAACREELLLGDLRWLTVALVLWVSFSFLVLKEITSL